MIKFLYGFELSEELEDPEELLTLADMYQVEGLKQATTRMMTENMNTDNVFRIVEIVGKDSEEFSKCVKFVEENFPFKTLEEDGVLDMYPRLGLALWNRKRTSSAIILDSVVRTFTEVSTSQMIKYAGSYPYQDRVDFSTSSDIMLTGIGMFVHVDSPDLSIEIYIYAAMYAASRYLTLTPTRLSNKNPDTNIQRVDFKPFALLRGTKYQLSVNISGQGWSDGGLGRCGQVIVDGLTDKGKFVKKVTFTFTDNNLPLGQIPELYFTVNG